MVEKTNAWMAVFIADITSMCGFGSDGAAALLSACSFVCCGSHQFLFPCLEVLFQSTPPLRAIGRKALPEHSVDVDSLHVSYADIFVSQVRAACGSSAQSQLTVGVEDIFWNATILHFWVCTYKYTFICYWAVLAVHDYVPEVDTLGVIVNTWWWSLKIMVQNSNPFSQICIV